MSPEDLPGGAAGGCTAWAAKLPPFFQPCFFTTIDSTSDEAARRARAGASEGLLVVAAEQTGGRGRRGRRWQSPPGNLYCSLLLRPPCRTADAVQLGFVAGLALARAIEETLGAESAGAGARVTCKWPNDILVGGRKIAGILLDAASDADGQCEWVIIGLGVNLRWHPGPAEGQFPATSLCAEAREGAVAAGTADPRMFLFRFAPILHAEVARWREQGFEGVHARWLDRAFALGEQITVRLDERVVTGVFAGLDRTGAMLLGSGAERRVITAGDVSSVRL